MPQTVAPDLSCLPLFASLSPEVLGRLRACLVFREVPADQELLKPGTRAGMFAMVERGLVCLEGADGILHTVGAGGCFGEAMLRYGVPSAFAARTLAPTSLWMLTHHDWLAARQAGRSEAGDDELAGSTAAKLEPSLAPSIQTASITSTTAHRHSGAVGKVWLLWIAILVLVLLVLGPQLSVAGGGWLAFWALDAQRPSEAADVMQFALAIQPDSASLHDAYGYLLFRQGDLSRARGEFEQALSLDPELASALNNLGVTLLAAGQPEEALSRLESAGALDPGNAALQKNLGDAFAASGNLEAAMAAYQRAFTLDPAEQAARLQWASLALQQGQLEAARQAWLEALRMQSDDPQAQLGLGLIAWQEGRPAAAAQHLQSARQADPGDPMIRLYLGLALQAMDRPEEAAVEFEQVLFLSQDAALLDLAREHLLELYRTLYASGSLPRDSMEGGEGLPVP